MPHHQQEETIILVPEAFRFKENLRYMQRSANECMFHILDDKVVKGLNVFKEDLLIEVSENIEGHLVMRFLGDFQPTNKRTHDKAVCFVRDWFDLETDLAPFYKIAKNDALLQHTVDKFYGLRIIGIPNLFEALSWGILGQQINLSYAYTLKRRLVEKFGRSIEWNDQSYYLFPAPEDIAKLSVEELYPIGMTVKKCEYLIEVAQQITEGCLSKSLLASTDSLKKAEKMLVNIRGIGPWTANYVLMRCLRFPDAFPIADVGLHNAIKHATLSDKKPTKEEIVNLAAPWKGWEAYATFYLWRLLY